METVTTGTNIIYVAKEEDFGKYIKNVYGQSIDADRLRNGDDYRFQIVDPFS